MQASALIRRMAVLLGLALLPAPPCAAAAPAANPDWPCVQRLVPRLTAGAYWPGFTAPANGEPDADPAVAPLVASVVPRNVPMEEGEARLAAFANGVPQESRPKRLADAFGALVDATNAERGRVIARIEELSRRQRELGDVVAKVTDELRSVPAEATDAQAARRAEIVQRRDFVIRSFDEIQRTMRYACEVPVQLESRLGRYARILRSKLPDSN